MSLFKKILIHLELINDDSEPVCDYEYIAAVNDKNVVQKIKNLAEANDPESQFFLGMWYSSGTSGFKRNQRKAVFWYSKAAHGGNVFAQEIMSKILLNGLTVKKDIGEGIAWLRKAAEQGNAKAQCSLGFYYLTGLFVSQDYEQALLWTQRSANQEYSAAIYNLGLMHMNGEGAPLDQKKGINLLKIAATKGDTSASKTLQEIKSAGGNID